MTSNHITTEPLVRRADIRIFRLPWKLPGSIFPYLVRLLVTGGSHREWGVLAGGAWALDAQRAPEEVGDLSV